MGKIHASRIPGLSVLLATGLFGLVIQPQVMGVESTTEEFVAKATVIRGVAGPQPQLSYFSLPTVPAAVYAGRATAIGSNTLTDTNAVWQANEFNGANGSFYVHFESGYMADIQQTDGASQTLTFPGTLPAGVMSGSAYKIRRHQTLASIFGPNNEFGLAPGVNPASADNVLVHIPETQQTLIFFYSAQPGFTGWYRSDYTLSDDMIIYPEQGLMVRRKVSGDLLVYLHGPTRTGSTQVPVFIGYNLLGTMQCRTALRLSELNLYTGDLSTGVAPGRNYSEADSLLLINPDSTTTTYFYSNVAGYEGWYNASFMPAGNVSIPAGTAFFLQRKEANGPFHWSLPEE